ncbi:MAG: AAA domain-containing protein, partial [Cyanobacteriota bacterium]
FVRRNKLINFFSTRNFKVRELLHTINAYKANYDSIKTDYLTIKRLLSTQLKCKLTLLELYKEIQLIDTKLSFSVSGYEDNLFYQDLQEYISKLCQLIHYFRDFETDDNILKKENRKNWTDLKADLILSSKENLIKVLSLLELIEHPSQLFYQKQIDISDIILLKNNIELIISMFYAIYKDKDILNVLNSWKENKYPDINFVKSLCEGKSYLENLNNNKWNIFEGMDLSISESLKENLNLYSKYKTIFKYLIPSWWKAKSRINGILNTYNFEICNENLQKIINKTDLTLQYNKLNRLINQDLAFIKPCKNNTPQEILRLLDISIKYFDSFKLFNNSCLNNILNNTEKIYNPETYKDFTELLQAIQNYNATHDQILSMINSLHSLFTDKFINLIIENINNIEPSKILINNILSGIDKFEDIKNFDNLYNSLNETQLHLLKSLVSNFDLQSDGIEEQWQKSIKNSFLICWLNNEEIKHPQLKDYNYQELQELGSEFTQKNFEEILTKINEILNFLTQIYNLIDKISYAFEDSFIIEFKELLVDNKKLNVFIEKFANCFADFDDLIKMDNIESEINNLHSLLLDQLKNLWPISTNNLDQKWESSIRKSFYEKWISEIESKHPELISVTDNSNNELVEALKIDYYKKLKANKENIHNKIKEQLKKLPETDKVRGAVKLKDLEYQVNKKRRLWSLRQLMKEYSNTHILEMLPCWLMSPDAVSSVMPFLEGLFDVVIFDEASQCTPEYALPSVIRAKQIIVAGDEKQLPPLNIFHTSLDEDFEDEISTEAQSLLCLAKAIYPVYLLSWHYRSDFEELINFSNHAFYNGKIQIAPNVKTDISQAVIEWKNVKDGLWTKNCNKKEAFEIVEYLKTLIINNPEHLTIGIVTFNATQQNLILDLIEKKESEDENFAKALASIKIQDLDNQLFVKNIENVQGDERDIIIFSIGYSKNYQGQVIANFGLLNRSGGENRLNVAISRARKKVVVFCSVDPDIFDVSKSKNEGPRLFKQYLHYAKSVSNANKTIIKSILNEINPEFEIALTELKNEYNAKFQQEVYEKLTQKGYKVELNVGCSDYKIDLAVYSQKNPGEFILGIECDGPNYYKAASARSRHITRKEFLKNKGWNIKQIWSRNWWLNSDKELNYIIEIINNS